MINTAKYDIFTSKYREESMKFHRKEACPNPKRKDLLSYMCFHYPLALSYTGNNNPIELQCAISERYSTLKGGEKENRSAFESVNLSRKVRLSTKHTFHLSARKEMFYSLRIPTFDDR